MANEEDYENVVFSDYDDFDSEYEKGKAIIDLDPFHVSKWSSETEVCAMCGSFLLPCLKLGLLKDVISSELNWDWLRYIISHLENLLFLFKGLKFLAESLLLLDLLVAGFPFKQ